MTATPQLPQDAPGERAGVRERPVLVVADHAITGELVESLVEASGRRPATPLPGEAVPDAIARIAPELVLLDFDHHASREDAPFQRARENGSRLVLFASGGDRRALERAGKQRGVGTCRLPIPHREFTAFLNRVLGR
ncbi:MAG TPA: hypothetical protein VMM18_09845 [Gemmatimonadaceae bacterium]|nr:hypothetical protein [Gemmatimonadaceae bacterium]